MGIDYELYCEAKIGGEWHNIDFLQRAPSGNLDIIPIISGRSFLGSALNWNGLCQVGIKHADLSPELREKFNRYVDDQNWAVFDYQQELKDKNFELPEHCGYFPKDAVNYFRTNGEHGILDEAVNSGEMLSPSQYIELAPEAQQGFMYYEYTEPFGIHDTMRRIKRGIEARIAAWDLLQFGDLWSEHIPDLDGPVRVVINIS